MAAHHAAIDCLTWQVVLLKRRDRQQRVDLALQAGVRHTHGCLGSLWEHASLFLGMWRKMTGAHTHTQSSCWGCATKHKQP
jgi:hypothetical protein